MLERTEADLKHLHQSISSLQHQHIERENLRGVKERPYWKRLRTPYVDTGGLFLCQTREANESG